VIDRVQPLKIESVASGGDETDQFPTALDRNEDYVDCRGIAYQHSTSDDSTVRTERDSSDNLCFVDPIVGHKTLAELASAAGLSIYDFLLDSEPNSVNYDYAISRTGGQVSQESWTNHATSKLLKSIDYTRSGGHVDAEVRKIFDSDGVTVVAQLTVTYTRSGGNVVSATYVRNV
jgi:hypothetical protein